MSRVDEALRRARDAATPQNGGEEAAEEPVAIQESAPAAAFPREPFPIEMPGRRPVHAPLRHEPASSAASRHEHDAPGHSRPAAAPERREPSESRLDRLLDRVDHRLSEKLIIDDMIMPASREQYRRLAAALHHMHFDGVSVIMIASAVPGEGKTLTASNLALTFSESYDRRVLLIDADLRRPTLHEVFRVQSHHGLTDGLTAAEERRIHVRQLSPRLCFLPAGRPVTDPMSCLSSVRLKRILIEAKESFDWVIIDTPPVGLLPDANLLGSMVDGVVLVIKAGSTPYDLVRRAVDLFGRNKIVGTVLNRADRQAFSSQDIDYYGYYGTYNSRITS